MTSAAVACTRRTGESAAGLDGFSEGDLAGGLARAAVRAGEGAGCGGLCAEEPATGRGRRNRESQLCRSGWVGAESSALTTAHSAPKPSRTASGKTTTSASEVQRMNGILHVRDGFRVLEWSGATTRTMLQRGPSSPEPKRHRKPSLSILQSARFPVRQQEIACAAPLAQMAKGKRGRPCRVDLNSVDLPAGPFAAYVTCVSVWRLPSGRRPSGCRSIRCRRPAQWSRSGRTG